MKQLVLLQCPSSRIAPKTPTSGSDAHLGEVHKARAKAFDLLICSDRTEGNLPEALLMEGPVCDSPHNIPFPPYNCHRAMPPVQHKPGYILPGHVGQLFGENVLQCNQPADESLFGSRHQDSCQCKAACYERTPACTGGNK